MQRTLGGPVRVPKPLDRLGPAGNHLDLVEHEHESARRPFRLASSVYPLPDEPLLVPHAGREGRIRRRQDWRRSEGWGIWLVNRDVAARLIDLRKRLTNSDGLPGLTRPEDGYDPPGRLGKAAQHRSDLGALE